MKHLAFLRSAAVLSAGGLLAKAIGVVYRIPLSNLLGGYGMGLYQLAYPLFCLLLTFSSTGIPSAFSRMIAREAARGGSGRQTLAAALKLFSLLGLAGTGLMCLFAPRMSALQGDPALLPCYLLLAPSVFFVAVIAVLRGYFQGKNDMLPTAGSELVEQLFKTALGLFFASRYGQTPARAVAGCLFAVTLSELAALVFLILRLRGEPPVRMLSGRRVRGSEVLFSALPVMAATSLLPLSQTVDSVLLVRLLRGAGSAVSLYGLYAGAALSLVSLPATACYGLSAASVPAVSRAFAQGRREEGKQRALFSLLLTLLLSLPCAVGLFVFARPVVSLLYGGLSAAEGEVLVSLLRTLSVSAVSLAGVDTLAACLTGMGRAKFAVLSMSAAVAVKFVLQCLLVGKFSVLGAAAAANACYLVAFFLDLFYTVREKTSKEKAYDHGRKSRRGAGRSDPVGAGSPSQSRRGAGAHRHRSAGTDLG